MWWTSSLRTADAFPVVASLPPLLFGGREATARNASAVRRLLNEVKEQVSQGCLTRKWLLIVVWRSTGVLIPLQEPFYRQHYSTASTSFEQKVKKVEIASLHENATLTYFRLCLTHFLKGVFFACNQKVHLRRVNEEEDQCCSFSSDVCLK